MSFVDWTRLGLVVFSEGARCGSGMRSVREHGDCHALTGNISFWCACVDLGSALVSSMGILGKAKPVFILRKLIAVLYLVLIKTV